jgi:hypothetical protein
MKKKLGILIILVLPILFGFGSCSSGPRFLERIPGGVLDGKVVGEEVNNWSFVAEAGLCDLETRVNFPHSVKLNCFNDGPELYIGCMSCEGKLWSSYISNDPRGRIRVEGNVYPVSFRRLEAGAEMDSAWRSRLAKLRPGQPVSAIPDGYWMYHLKSMVSEVDSDV